MITEQMQQDAQDAQDELEEQLKALRSQQGELEEQLKVLGAQQEKVGAQLMQARYERVDANYLQYIGKKIAEAYCGNDHTYSDSESDFLHKELNYYYILKQHQEDLYRLTYDSQLEIARIKYELYRRGEMARPVQ